TGIQLLLRRVDQLDISAISSEAVPALLQSQQQSLRRVEKQIGRLTRLLDDLIDLSRVRSGKLEVQPEQCNLSALVTEMVEGERLAHPQRVVHLALPEGEPVQVLADPDRVGQVITNYMTNALKYSPSDQPVDVGLKVEGDQVQVWVRDHGPGI